MNRKKVWINGRFFDIDKAKISIFDRGFLYGDGVFETMRSYAGVIFKADKHLDRLLHSLKLIHIRAPYNKEELKRAIYRCLKINNIKNAYIRITVTRGEGRLGIDTKERFKPNVVIVTKEFNQFPQALYERGLSVKCAKTTRQNESSPISNIKSINFLNYIFARMEAKRAGFDEAILLNTRGSVSEGATSNIFIVRNGSILTPSIESGILPGITRDVIISIAKKLKIKVVERSLTHKDLLNSEEAFLTNSLIEVLPVARVDKKVIGSGRVGVLTKLFRISYQKDVIREVLNLAT